MDRNQDVRMTCGDDRTISIAIANQGGVELAGATGRWIMARSAMDGPPLLDKAVAISTDDPPQGYAATMQVPIDSSDTAALAPGWYHHEAGLVLQSGARMLVASGTLRLDPTGTPSPE